MSAVKTDWALDADRRGARSRTSGDALGCLHRIRQQHGDGHRPHAARYRRDVRSFLLRAFEVDIPDEEVGEIKTVGNAVDYISKKKV